MAKLRIHLQLSLMGLTGLLAGIFLPWMLGSLLLRSLLRIIGSQDAAANLPLVTGYGFFIGYALTISAVMPIYRLAGIGTPYLILFLLLISIILLLWLDPPGMSFNLSLPSVSNSNFLSFVLLGVILLHAGFSLQQLLTNPILPWDAWSTWAYRAKMWYLAGPAPFVSPHEWLIMDDTNRYTIDAFNYPSFVSILYLWSALTLGEWQENLLGISWLGCFLAIITAVYGHARWVGARRNLALLLAALLSSIPLFNVHSALQGYADLWMAGYAGLGVAALMSGSIRRDLGMAGLGLTMLFFGLMVKQEGSVWLLLGLILVAMPKSDSKILQNTVQKIAKLSALVILTFVLINQWTAILPTLNPWGFVNHPLFADILNQFSLGYPSGFHNVLANMFFQASWNIYWPLLAILLIFSLFNKNRRVRDHLIGLILGYLTTLALIFLFSQHAQWVADNTAFNRVALHLLPALILSITHLDAFKNWSSKESA